MGLRFRWLICDGCIGKIDTFFKISAADLKISKKLPKIQLPATLGMDELVSHFRKCYVTSDLAPTTRSPIR